MSQYPSGPNLATHPWVTYFGFDEAKAAWLYYYWFFVAAYSGVFILVNRILLSKRRTWYKVVERV